MVAHSNSTRQDCGQQSAEGTDKRFSSLELSEGHYPAVYASFSSSEKNTQYQELAVQVLVLFVTMHITLGLPTQLSSWSLNEKLFQFIFVMEMTSLLISITISQIHTCRQAESKLNQQIYEV